MIYTGLNRTGQIETVKAHGGADVAEVYGGINESNPIYYKSRSITGQTPLSYKALGQPLTDYLISGNAVQDGTPSSEAPVNAVGCGIWDETQQSYKLPLTVNETEFPIYLGEVESTRRIKKLVLDGTENWVYRSGYPSNVFFIEFIGAHFINNSALCTHYLNQDSGNFNDLADKHVLTRFASDGTKSYIGLRDSSITSIKEAGVLELKAYLAQQYAAGTPVTVWYILANKKTGIVNEPLMKIGDYADNVSYAQAGVTIPTVSGTNVLDMTSPVKPSEVYIKGNIKSIT